MDHKVIAHSPCYKGIILFVHSFNQNLFGISKEPSRHLLAFFLYGIKYPVELTPDPFFTLPSFHGCGRCSGPWRIDKGEGSVKPYLPDNIDGIIHILSCLTRKTNDDIGGDRRIRQLFSYLQCQVKVFFFIILSVHALKYPAAPGLKGQVDVLTYLP